MLFIGGRADKAGCHGGARLKALFAAVALLLTSSGSNAAPAAGKQTPIVLDRSGGFIIGGKVIHNPKNPNQTLSCDHGYMEYFIPWNSRRTSLVMWHSSSTQVFQNRWDGGTGYKDLFLRRDYPVYLWDGPRVGRANWSCDRITYVPTYRDQENFLGWNFGPRLMEWWGDVQFPTQDEAAWQEATASRYDEFDTEENVELQSTAAAIAADSGRIGDSIVYVTNSAGGLRAQMTVIKANSTNIKGLVMYESIGLVFPDTADVRAANGGFGPYVVPEEDFKKLARLKAVQFVWGDHREHFSLVNQSQYAAALINKYGGNAEVLNLGNDAGLKGSTHLPFADMDNEKVADLMDGYLSENGLDGYA